MEKKQLAVVVVGVFCSAAFAGAPLGPPRSLVEHGQWAINFEYGHEEMDLKTYGKIIDQYISDGEPSGDPYCGYSVMQVSDLELNAFFGSLEYGLCDRWEVFLRVGIADAQDDVAPMYCFEDEEDEVFNFDGGYGFAWGAGTKMTICQHGDWTFGAVIQVTWLYPDESDLTWVNPADANECFDGEGDLDLRQIQAGVGATLDLSSALDGLFVYGGICWCFFRGDLDVDGSFYDTDVEYLRIDAEHNVDEEHEFGFWAGLGCQLETAVCFGEVQWLDDYWLVGGGVKIPLP